MTSWADRLGGDALDAARLLLGAELWLDGVGVRITEVEAYRGAWDTASHTRMGRTPRNAPMWGPAGRAYVYLCYGVHHLLNVVTGPEGEGAAVLLRAGEVVAGLDVALSRGGRALAAGPGLLTQALGVDRRWSGHDLLGGDGLVLRDGRPPARVIAGPRVGIGYASTEHQAVPWRLADADSDAVTHRRHLGPG